MQSPYDKNRLGREVGDLPGAAEAAPDVTVSLRLGPGEAVLRLPLVAR